MTKPQHKWRVVGRDYNTTVPNIWKCQRCSLVKCECWDFKLNARKNALLDPRIEFSKEDGEVISAGVRKHIKIPSCCE
jgi:hypothetical protein